MTGKYLYLLFFFVLVNLLWTPFSFAQVFSSHYVSTGWNEGTVTLRDGTYLEGLVYFNNAASEILYKPDEDQEEITFKENKVSLVTYFDEVTKSIRRYKRFETVINHDMKDARLYEVIKEFDQFVVLSRKGGLHLEAKITDRRGIKRAAIPEQKPRTVIHHYEFIFFSYRNAGPDLFMTITNRFASNLFYERSSARGEIKIEILSKYMDTYWPIVSQYIKENKLRLKRKEDIIKVLDFYEHLTN